MHRNVMFSFYVQMETCTRSVNLPFRLLVLMDDVQSRGMCWRTLLESSIKLVARCIITKCFIGPICQIIK